MSGTDRRGSRPHSPGDCPHCEARIPRGAVLIEYETVEGPTRMFAECPDCGEVVHPGSP